MTGKTLSVKAIIGGHLTAVKHNLFSKRIELVFKACVSPHCLVKLNNQFNMQHKTLVPVI